MKQEIKEELDKIFKKLTPIFNSCVVKNRGNVTRTIVDFIGKQTKIQNMIHKRTEELNLSESEKEEIDKYYYIKMTELLDYYFEN